MKQPKKQHLATKYKINYQETETNTAINKGASFSLFYLKYCIKSEKHIMQPAKEFQEKMRIINASQSEKGISMALALQWTTGRAITNQWWEVTGLPKWL